MMDRALFMDRDGVINVDYGYVHEPSRFTFIDDIFLLCRRAMALGYRLVIVSNQAGIGRGLYSEAQYQALTAWMRKRFDSEGVVITAVYHCPYHPVHGIGDFKRDSEDRKPKPGMLLRASAELGLDLGRSVLLGDQPTDIQAAVAAGVGLKLLYHTSHPIADNVRTHGADAVIDGLSAAIPYLERFILVNR